MKYFKDDLDIKDLDTMKYVTTKYFLNGKYANYQMENVS